MAPIKAERLENLVRELFLAEGCSAVPGGEVLVPGEPERQTRAKRLAEGIPLFAETWEAICATAREVGMREPVEAL